ncbi:MAG TPA: cyclic nucleotide-binding domain-containing protein [Ignavibacteriales bacterium]|nr:cyclic nucleotide-binding domain-containing protein [Ignavibacteriales bacterium]HOL80666.1 cyclic nucleotide-binding domain-containing protein [Ignavibacteriales bacterium]HOM64354.1 cyclic nucleotide-binding domain-containing protein [Ignavibacteriales bacterium]HPD67142.1 cyclic nucleotide-binding domain-containing protein [Ignavibacteriales bacterium]HPP33001.1 cyclic nucleotide-binding domain-containing protein [Ignavibacteriales bacterium]
MISNSVPTDAYRSQKKTFNRGTIIAREGDESKEIFILISGRIAVYKKLLKVAEIVEQGAVFGEISLLLGGKRNNSLIAAEDNTEVFILSTSLDNIVKDQQLCKKLIYDLASRLVRTTETLAMLDLEL